MHIGGIGSTQKVFCYRISYVSLVFFQWMTVVNSKAGRREIEETSRYRSSIRRWPLWHTPSSSTKHIRNLSLELYNFGSCKS
jgi:hypothetical protein